MVGNGFPPGKRNLGMGALTFPRADPGRNRAARGSASAMVGDHGCAMSATRLNGNELKLLSIVIPARDEEGCIASTVEHLYLELRLNKVPHEIVVVDDGSTDHTWEIL